MTTHIPKESSTVKGILKYLNSLPGCKAEKTHGGQYGNAGKPDVTGSLGLKFKDMLFGLRLEFEVKRPGGVTSKLQEVTLAEWRQAGAVTAVVYSVDEVKRIIEEVQEQWKGAMNR